MRRFFWQGAETNGTQGRALVKWSTVCRPRGQESPTHQCRTAYEVGMQTDASSIVHGHPGLDGQL